MLKIINRFVDLHGTNHETVAGLSGCMASLFTEMTRMLRFKRLQKSSSLLSLEEDNSEPTMTGSRPGLLAPSLGFFQLLPLPHTTRWKAYCPEPPPSHSFGFLSYRWLLDVKLSRCENVHLLFLPHQHLTAKQVPCFWLNHHCKLPAVFPSLSCT